MATFTFSVGSSDSFKFSDEDPCGGKAKDYQDKRQAAFDAVKAASADIAANAEARSNVWSAAEMTIQKGLYRVSHPTATSDEADAWVVSQHDAQVDEVASTAREAKAATDASRKAADDADDALAAWRECQNQMHYAEDGCGSRGGPGYRLESGKCANWDDVSAMA